MKIRHLGPLFAKWGFAGSCVVMALAPAVFAQEAPSRVGTAAGIGSAAASPGASAAASVVESAAGAASGISEEQKSASAFLVAAQNSPTVVTWALDPLKASSPGDWKALEYAYRWMALEQRQGIYAFLMKFAARGGGISRVGVPTQRVEEYLGSFASAQGAVCRREEPSLSNADCLARVEKQVTQRREELKGLKSLPLGQLDEGAAALVKEREALRLQIIGDDAFLKWVVDKNDPLLLAAFPMIGEKIRMQPPRAPNSPALSEHGDKQDIEKKVVPVIVKPDPPAEGAAP